MVSVVEKRGKLCVDGRDQFNKRFRIVVPGNHGTKAEARRAAILFAAKLEKEIEQGSYDSSTRKLTFSELADFYLESKVNIRVTTRKSYSGLIELYLKPYFGARRIQQISAADIERFRNLLVKERPPPILEAFAERERKARPGLSRARAKQKASQKVPGVRTINKNLTLLVMIFGYAERHRWIDFNAASHVEKLKQPRRDDEMIDSNVLAPDEINRLLEAADTPLWHGNGKLKRNNAQLLIKTAVFTGMRSGEIRGLQWGDIDWSSKQLHIRRAWREDHFAEPKTLASRRRIDLPTQIVTELKAWKLKCPVGDDDLVFPNLVGNPISHANLLQRMFYPTLRRAGLRKTRFHDLRHTFASLLIASGEDIVRVSRLLGHSSPAVTLAIYSHMLPKEHYGSADRLIDTVLGATSKVLEPNLIGRVQVVPIQKTVSGFEGS